MKLTKRLQAIADLIDEKTYVIDVGCDHALLDIYLTKHKKNICIASDINENVIKIAKENIKANHLEEEIECIKSNGLENIVLKKPNTVCIAGMGTTTILNILDNPKVLAVDNLIIQTNNEWSILRKEISKKGFKLIEEKIIKEHGKFYIIMKWVKGKSKLTKKQCYLGINNNHQYLSYLLNQNKEVLSKIPWQYFKKRRKIKQQIKWIKKELNR